MSERTLRRDLAVLTISAVRELTGLSDRQIRYYDQQALIEPSRGAGKQRRYSLDDIDRLIEIADYMDAGYSIAEIRAVEHKQKQKEAHKSEQELRRFLADEMLSIGRFSDRAQF
ncbi:MerR family transcriptional regulator [Weissella tructae]|uniref:Glutamine synthetase repressor n=2 Tax=Weissella TaxID=46255 RepID=A0A075U066_9LACO|nr:MULTISPECIES: MerR family transcriptional regulator [Weissella]AIG65930.1 Glutamine synthetase repressor [Weissella tructae]AIM63308.1 Glutamine synthetase repressor [Weissella ceti]AIM64643.1 Glutamine synthetase repressor [Weissella ceti]ELA07301.1 transcriptional regulator [Weissella ceti NC36]QVV91979.1 MerR family transcriptional regulator [Weissella tructae]